MTLSTQFPGGQSPNLYINGMVITNDSVTPNSLLNIALGAARDSTNQTDIIVASAAVINTAVNGLNGLDTGTIAALTTSGHMTTYAAVSLVGGMPPSSQIAILDWLLTPATAANTALLRPTGSASTTNRKLTGSVASQPNAGQLFLNTNASQSIDYITSSNSDALTLNIAAYQDSL